MERATIARRRRRLVAAPGSEREFEVDAVCTAYGFLPSTDLARTLGCELAGDAVAHDQDMQTTVKGVFVAGEASGIGGADLARGRGRAGRRLRGRPRRRRGLAAPPPRPRGLVRRRSSRTSSGRRPGLAALADADTVLCRCEDVTAGEVDAAGAARPRPR